MIVYFPTLYPDELVYSWFCRYYIHSGCLSHQAAMQELYCKRSDNPSKEFIGNLNIEAKQQIEKMSPLDKLILEHTMYPQYARFIPLEQKKTALRRLVYDSCDAHQLFTVLPRNESEQYLRFCPLCAMADREIYGEAYWHRKHQIRNMSICTRHNCKLMESSVPVKSEQSYTFCPAENCIQSNKVIFESDLQTIQFAKYLESVFDAPMDFDNDTPISSILYDGLSRTKYLKPSGRCRSTVMLANDMNKFYESMGIHSIASMYQIQRVLLGSRFDFSVVCQIAFFLGMKPEELLSPDLTQEQIQKEQDSHYMKDAAPIDWKQLDEKTAPILEKAVRSIHDGTANANGRPERVSERLVYRAMGVSGYRLENMPRCKAIFERYTESYPESWARKIIWAYQKLSEEGRPFYWSDIRKISGVKKKDLLSIIPYLTKYADEDTVVQIMDLILFRSDN